MKTDTAAQNLAWCVPERNLGIQRTIKDFRAKVALAMFRNSSYASIIQSKYFCPGELAELCDQLAMYLCFSWLATKYGFPEYPSAISEEHEIHKNRLAGWTCLQALYPLNLPNGLLPGDQECRDAVSLLENRLTPELSLPGMLYQSCMITAVYPDRLGKVVSETLGNARQSGEFYTPDWLVDYCLERILDAQSTEMLNCIHKSLSDGSVTDAESFQSGLSKELRILDPACGSGNFFIGLISRLQRCGFTSEQRFRFITKALYGIDIDARAVHLCRLSLLLACSESFSRGAPSGGDQAGRQSIAGAAAEISARITIGNSVLSFAAEREGKFDLVIGNPPYVSFGARNQAKLPNSWQQFLRSCYTSSAEYKIRLYSIFQEIALRAAKDGGYVCLLVPDAFLNGSYYQRLRRYILQESTIISLSELPSNAIPRAVVGNWCVTCYKKKSMALRKNASANYRTSCRDGIDESVKLYKLHNGALATFAMKRSTLVSQDKSRFQLVFCREDAELLEITKALQPLGTNLRGHTGIRAKQGQSGIIAALPHNEFFKPGITSGARVRPYRVDGPDAWLEICPEKLYGGGFSAEIVQVPKILMRQTGDAIIAALDKSGLYHLNNVHSFVLVHRDLSLQDVIDQLQFYCGLLNSRLYLHLYRIKSREHKRALAQVDIEMVEAMPLPEIGMDWTNIVSEAAAEMSSFPKPTRMRELEAIIDMEVYKAFGLSRPLIRHVELATSKGEACDN